MWPLTTRILFRRPFDSLRRCAADHLKKTGSIEYISNRSYSHSINRLSVVPAVFGT